MKNLDVAKRGCVFPDEMDLHVYHVYTESSCLIECRYMYIAKQCNCYLYYFPPPGNTKYAYNRGKMYQKILRYWSIISKFLYFF